MALQVLGNTPLPDRNAIADKLGFLTREWWDYFRRLPLTLGVAQTRVNSVLLTGYEDSIPATDLSSGPLPAGAYRVEWYARITRAATTLSSLTVTLDWTDGGVNPTRNGAAITGNTTTTTQSGVALIRCDAGTAINYSTTYSSSGATGMQYEVYFVLTRVEA